jgi:serine protease Do
MSKKWGECLKTKRFGLKTLTTVGLSFMVAGLLVASGLNWTAPSVGKGLEAGAKTALTSPAAPGSFAEIAEKLSPTVVNIKVTKTEKVGFDHPQIPEGPFGDFFERFFKDMPQGPQSRKIQGAGSGVIISSDGYILTNNHVVEGAREITVTLSDKQEYRAKVVGRDPKTDLAVVKIDAPKSLPAASLGNSDQLKVGEWVVAIGNPFGLSDTVTAGIVSAKGRVIGAGPYDDFIQTDASINPGNSGGPLLNMKGEVVGINTAILPEGQGIGFAIPVNTAKPLIPQLESKGKVTRGYLGVNIQSISTELAKALKLKETRGALVADVVEGSPAEKAGVKRGDVIVAYNGNAVEDSHTLPAMVAATPVGREITLTVLRDGKEQQLRMEVGKLPSDETKAEAEESAQPAGGKLGLRLHTVNPELARQLGLRADQGVVVMGVEPGSPAAEAGIQQGDVILEVNRKPVTSINDVKEQVSKTGDGDQVLLLVQRDQAKLYVPVSPQG